MQRIVWKSNICALRKREFPMGLEFRKLPRDRKFPKVGKFPNLGNLPGIPIWEIPGRKKFKAIWVGANGNFPLNILVPGSQIHWQGPPWGRYAFSVPHLHTSPAVQWVQLCCLSIAHAASILLVVPTVIPDRDVRYWVLWVLGRGLHSLRNSVSAVCERKQKWNSVKRNSV